MSDNTAFLVTVAGLVALGWGWPILDELRQLLIAKLRARRAKLEARS